MSPTTSLVRPSAAVGQYLAFSLAGEEYGLASHKIQEVNGMMAMEPATGAPSWIRGVISMRGQTIPVVDLRAKLGLPARPDTETTCILVVRLTRGDGDIVAGLVVDEASDVLDVTENLIEPPPTVAIADREMAGVVGRGRFDQRSVILLDIDAVFTDSEQESIVRFAD